MGAGASSAKSRSADPFIAGSMTIETLPTLLDQVDGLIYNFQLILKARADIRFIDLQGKAPNSTTANSGACRAKLTTNDDYTVLCVKDGKDQLICSYAWTHITSITPAPDDDTKLQIRDDASCLSLGFVSKGRRDFFSVHLNACISPYGQYHVEYTDFGKLGLVFTTQNGIITPLILAVQEPSLSLGVKMGSILTMVNGQSVQKAERDGDVSTFAADPLPPKTLTFERIPPWDCRNYVGSSRYNLIME